MNQIAVLQDDKDKLARELAGYISREKDMVGKRKTEKCGLFD